MPKLTTSASARRLSPQLSLVELAGPELNSTPALNLPQRPATLPPHALPLTAPLITPLITPLTARSTAAPALRRAPLAPEQIAPLITSEQLQLVTSGLEALSQPLLKYLDPEEHYQVVRHTSAEQDYQHLTLALKSACAPQPDPNLRPSAVIRFRAPTSENCDQQLITVEPEGTNEGESRSTTTDALVLPLTQPTTCCSFFSGTPKAADLQTWRNPAYQALGQNSVLPAGKLTIRTPQGLMRLDPDCNLLLDVYGLLFEHTGFCTLPIFTSNEQERAQPYYQCLNQSAQRYRELFALFYYSVGGVSLEQSRTQLYRELYVGHDHHSSSLGQALSTRSAERAFLEQKRAVSKQESVVGAGVPQVLIGQYQEWTRAQYQISPHPLPTPQSAPELVGTPHQWWDQERSVRSHYRPDKTPDHDLTLDYLCAGFERLCLSRVPEQVQNLVAAYQPWEVVVDASNLGSDAALARTKVQSQRLQSHDPRRASPQEPERSLTKLAQLEQLRHPQVASQLSAELAGGCYWGHEVKLYALPSIMAPAPDDTTTALSLLKAWESERVAAYWQQLEQLCTCPDAAYYPQLFSHDGTPWYRATQQLLKTPNQNYDGSEQSRRTLTGQVARAYSLEQSLTYSAGHESKLAEIMAAPHSILRTYLSEAARSEATPLLQEEQLFLRPSDRRAIPDYETLQIKLMAQSGLSHELCAYYCTTTRRKLNLLVAKSSSTPQAPAPQAQQPQASSLKGQSPQEQSLKAQSEQSLKAQPEQSLKAQPSKAQPPKAPSLNTLLNQAATALYLKGLVRHYYTELRLQGLLYQEHIRLPLTQFDPVRPHRGLSSAVLRLVLTATSARPDLHFCGARLGQPFALSARPQRPNRAEHLEHRLNLAHFDPDPSGRRTRGKRVLSSDLRCNRSPITTPCEHDAELEPLYCDLSLYFTKPSTELERAQHLVPQLKRSAQALERNSPAQFYSRNFALQGQRSNLEQALPLWTREQIRTTRVSQALNHPLTFVQHYVLTQLQHGRSFGPESKTQYQALSCPELNARCANPNGTYQGQINLFLAAAVYQGARQLSHLADLPAISAQGIAPQQETADSAHFPSFGLFLYTLEALENQEALAVQCQCGHSSIVFNPKLDPRDSELEQLCPHCPNNLLL